MKYVKLLRVKHYLKNVLVFLPLIFSGNLFKINYLVSTIFSFISFCLIASIVYIINDIKDVESDRLHEVKRHRPIASGEVSIKQASIIVIILLIFSFIINYLASKSNLYSTFLLYGYLVLNILYCLKLKKIPVLDCLVLTLGFVIRVLYGASTIGVTISHWLYLTVLSAAFYVVLGKRRNEIIKQGVKTRNVLKYYNKDFLDKNMYVFVSLSIMFYSLWCIDLNTVSRINNNLLLSSVPIVIFIFMKYSLDVEGNSHGDPVDVVFSDKVLLTSIICFGIYMLALLYFI